MSGSRQLSSGVLPFMTNSLSIRQEIQRFESVHPSIYAIYDLIELIPDPMLAQQIREHVVCIEDSFVNSQEWTLARGVPEIRLGIVGSLSSGKSALVHRYLTGSYMQEESPEGGRFKKEIVVDGQSYLLLIRDEGGPPESQFSSWVDAVIFVFSLENEPSFNAIYNYYSKMAQLRNIHEIPLILVGTQDAISEGNPREIDDIRARKLANDLKRCSYYETCATYGLNVERVFQDACQKICQSRSGVQGGSRPTTPNHFISRPYPGYLSSPTTGYGSQGGAVVPAPHSPRSNSFHQVHSPAHGLGNSTSSKESRLSTGSVIINPEAVEDFRLRIQNATGIKDVMDADSKFLVPANGETKGDKGDLPTPSNTPTSVRKNKRRSNLFTPSSKKGGAEEKKCGEVGSGRSIPIRQGYFYKKSSKSFSKDWKKKYVTLCDDGRMTYHPSLHDYMDNVHGKDIPLNIVTVKVPGQHPRGMRTVPMMGNGTPISSNKESKENTIAGLRVGDKKGEKVTLTGYEMLKEASGGEDGDGRVSGDTPNVKKRNRKLKGGQDCDDSEVFEFLIVSLDNKQWQFETGSAEDRDAWVQAIEQQILNCLQGIESNKSKDNNTNRLQEQAAVSRIRSEEIGGNNVCVDCGSPNPGWSSLNLGVLLCIECGGIHRNLGSHISRVRSLDLDEWPPGHLAVMMSLGNHVANTIWEARLPVRFRKPDQASSQEEKEKFIKAKYERKEFLAQLPGGHSPAQALIDSICRSDMAGVSLALSHASEEDVNSTVSARDARTSLHLAAALGDLGIAQLLIWANSNVKAVDHDGRMCVSHARNSGAQDVVDLLLAAGCPDVALTGTLPRRHKNQESTNGRKKEDVKKTSSIL